MGDSINMLIQQINSLQQRRYPTALVVLDNGLPALDDLKVVAQDCDLRCIDYREDVLARPDSSVVLGAYIRADFRDWLILQARECGGILIWNVDDLISTWSEHDRKAFYLDFLHIESNSMEDRSRKAPIVLLSRLAENFALPSDDRGQGIVTRAFAQNVQGAM